MSSICIVDDNRPTLARLRRAFGAAGFDNVMTESDPLIAVSRIRQHRPDVLVVDYNMPQLNGLAMVELLQSEGIVPHLPVVLLSGLDLSELRLAAFKAGAVDVIDKRVAEQELIHRVSNFAAAGHRHATVVAPLHGAPEGANAVGPTMLRMLERLSALHDEPSGPHVHRVAAGAAAIGAAAGLAPSDLDVLRAAVPLHDIGKIGIADAARRNGRAANGPTLDDLRSHTTTGHHILEGHGSHTLDVAAQIALTHHESWDGSGFPNGLRGVAIPVFARIVAVADAFELITAIPNRPLHWLVTRAKNVIAAESGVSFDPDIVRAFEASIDAMVDTKLRIDGAAMALDRKVQPALAN